MSFHKAPNARRLKVFSKTDGKCHYCGCALCYKTFHIDHIEPTSRGGVNLQENLAPACPDCNTSKGPKTIEEGGLFALSELITQKLQSCLSAKFNGSLTTST